MKSALFLCFMLLVTSIAYAESYKWEDANGVHFTDNASSIPEKYRAKALGEAREDISAVKPRRVKFPTQQSVTIAKPENQRNIEQAEFERNRILAESLRSQAALRKQSAIQARMEKEVLQPLAQFMVIWILLGALTFILWLLALLDIVSNEFYYPSNKIVWVLLVLFLPLLGALLYFMIGSDQKISRPVLTRLNPKDQKDGEFKID